MKKITLTLLVITSMQYSHAQTPSWQWARNSGGSMYDAGQSMTHDSFGNVYVTGSFESPFIKVDSTTLINTTGGDGCFLAKYDSSGNLLWAVSPTGSCYSLGICIDPFGYIYITGSCSRDTVQFGNILLTHARQRDFIAKYDSSGNVVWAINAGSEGDYGKRITTDANGNIYMIGEFFNLHITIGSTTLTNAAVGFSDILIVKLDSSGNTIWANSGSGDGTDEPSGLAVDAAGAAYITGYFTGQSITFGNFTFTNTNTAVLFVVKYDSSGIVSWAHQGNSASVGGIAIDHSNNAYITGGFHDSTLTFGSTTLINTGGHVNLYILKYDSSGNAVWAQSAGVNDYALGRNITIDANDNIYVSGAFASLTATFNGITLNNTIDSLYFDTFIAKYDSSGIAIWAKDAGNGPYDLSTCVDDFGNFYMAGTFSDTAIFDNDSLFSYGNGDCFVAKLANQITSSNFDFTSQVLPLLIYPNPAINNFAILLTGNHKKVDVIITDITGKIIYKTTKTETQKIEINTNEFAEGIYIVQILSAGFIGTKKLVVEK